MSELAITLFRTFLLILSTFGIPLNLSCFYYFALKKSHHLFYRLMALLTCFDAITLIVHSTEFGVSFNDAPETYRSVSEWIRLSGTIVSCILATTISITRTIAITKPFHPISHTKLYVMAGSITTFLLFAFSWIMFLKPEYIGLTLILLTIPSIPIVCISNGIMMHDVYCKTNEVGIQEVGSRQNEILKRRSSTWTVFILSVIFSVCWLGNTVGISDCAVQNEVIWIKISRCRYIASIFTATNSVFNTFILVVRSRNLRKFLAHSW